MTTEHKKLIAYLSPIVLTASLGSLLFGYDIAVIFGAEKGLQGFFLGAEDFTYTNALHNFTCTSALIGCIIGSALSGKMDSKFGHKLSLAIAGTMLMLSSLGSMSPEFIFFLHGEPSLGVFITFNLYRILGGVGVGIISAICPVYIGEAAPPKRRGMLVSINQFAIIIGMLMAYLVNYIILGDNTNPSIETVGGVSQVINSDASTWTILVGWRDMCGSEAIPASLFTILILQTPKSKQALALESNKQHAKLVEEQRCGIFAYGKTCIFIGIMLCIFQQIIGINAVLYYAQHIFGDMGLRRPMLLTVIMGVANLAFTLIAIFTIDKIGRKPLLILGSIGMALGAFGVVLSARSGSALTCLLFVMFYSGCFMFSWGPVCWVLISEIFPIGIRSRAVALSVAFQWAFNYVIINSFMSLFNTHIASGDHVGYWLTFGLYGAACILAALFVWKMVPETKGIPLKDMGMIWNKTLIKEIKISTQTENYEKM